MVQHRPFHTSQVDTHFIPKQIDLEENRVWAEGKTSQATFEGRQGIGKQVGSILKQLGAEGKHVGWVRQHVFDLFGAE